MNARVQSIPKMDDIPSMASLAAFLIDKEAENLSPASLGFYRQKVTGFLRYLARNGTTRAQDITAHHVRAFLVDMKSDHTPGGLHAYYRAIKAFCRWLYAEGQIASDLFQRVKAPKVPLEILDPVRMDTVQVLLSTCNVGEQIGARDHAAILTLLDTGLRAAEFLALNVGDMDLEGGTMRVRKAKGGKQRFAFLGQRARSAIAHYLEFRTPGQNAPLWVTRDGTRLSYTGLRDILRRRAGQADIPAPTLHSFRRAFALLCLRRGVDIYSLQRLMGHSDITVLRRYLAQTEEDLQKAHRQASPVDNLPALEQHN